MFAMTVEGIGEMSVDSIGVLYGEMSIQAIGLLHGEMGKYVCPNCRSPNYRMR